MKYLLFIEGEPDDEMFDTKREAIKKINYYLDDRNHGIEAAHWTFIAEDFEIAEINNIEKFTDLKEVL